MGLKDYPYGHFVADRKEHAAGKPKFNWVAGLKNSMDA
jgi:hypothetical protein